MNPNFSIRFQVVRENTEPTMPGIFGNNTVIEISNNTLDNSPMNTMYMFESNFNNDTPSFVMSRLFDIFSVGILNNSSDFNINLDSVFNDSLNHEQPVTEKATNDMLKELGPYRRIKENDKLLESECVICSDKYQKDEGVRDLDCSHIFHKKCIDRWFKEGSTCCPICRKCPFKKSSG